MLFHEGQACLADGVAFEQRPELNYISGEGSRQWNVKSKGIEAKLLDMFKEWQGGPCAVAE